MLAFYLTEIWGISAIRNLSFSVFAGAIFPLDILPQKIQMFLLLSPFPFISFIPSKILIDSDYVVDCRLIGIGLMWTIILISVLSFLWYKGKKRYTSCGI